MTDWTTVFSSGAVALILGLCGIAFKFLTDRQTINASERSVLMNDRAAFLVTVLDEVKQLRLVADKSVDENRELFDDLRKVKADLLECLTVRHDLALQIKDHLERIRDLESHVSYLPPFPAEGSST